MADALPTLEINMQHQNIRPRHAVPDNEIERAAILLPEHATIYRDPRFVAVVWTVDTSDRTTAQVLGCQRRCLPFLARHEVFAQLCSDRALRTVDGGLWAEGLAVTPEHYLGLWRAALGRPLSAAQFARQFGVYAAAVFDAPLAPLRGQASSWSSSPFERFDDIESRYAARMRYRNDTQAFELVLDLREPDAARDAFYLESFVLAAGLGEAATIEVQLRPTEHRAASLPAQPQLFAEAA